MSKENTGYPSIDKTHKKNERFLDLHPIIPNLSLYNALNLMSIPFRKENAVDCLELTITFDELLKDSKVLSKAFKELGIKQNDIITVAMPNFSQAVAIFLAANRIGATVAFLNSNAEIGEIKRYLNLFESPLFVTYNKDIDYNEQIKKDTKVRQIVTLKSTDLNRKEFNENNKLIGYNDFISYNDLKLVGDFYRSYINTMYNGSQNALIQFTSGSTGNPKSVVLTNGNLLSSGIYMKNSTHIKNTKGEKSLICVPFCYPYGFATSTLMSLLCGREAILAPNLSAKNINYFLNKNPNIVFGSPALLELIKRNTDKNQDLSSIDTFISGGDFLTQKQALEAIKFFAQHNANVDICNGFGNAETSATSSTAVGVPKKPQTVGKILLGTEAIIINPDTGEECKYYEEGLLCIAGKHVFKEYYKEKELTEDAFFQFKGKKYFKTGTRGFLDTDGYFTLLSRDSRFYITSSLNKIYCDYVQNIIGAIDCIDSCAVVKMPHDDLLYVGKVFITLKEGVLANEETLNYIRKKCTEQITINQNGDVAQLKPYEIPVSFEFIDRLPRNIADKVDYATLEKNAQEEYENNKGHQKKIVR